MLACKYEAGFEAESIGGVGLRRRSEKHVVLSSLFGKEIIVGIDIGSSCIKAVEIEPTSTGWTVTSAAVTPTPPNAIKEGVIINVVDVSQSIRSLLKDAGMKPTGAVCAVSGSQVIVRQVQFPTMPEAALRKSIRYEASKHISSSVEDSVVEFEILGEGDEAGTMQVMLVAAPREMVDCRVAVLEAAGLEPLTIDIEAFALIRSLVEFSATDEYLHRTVALIDMGAGHTDVNIVSRGQFVLTRNIPIAGDSYTNAIKSLAGASFEDAEKMKLDMTSGATLDEISSGQSENRSWRVVQPLLDELIREVRRSIHYYQSQFPEGSQEALVSKIMLTGGSTRMRGMESYVSGKLGIPTEIADVFRQSAVSSGNMPPSFADENSPILAVCTGLALKELIPEAGQKAA